MIFGMGAGKDEEKLQRCFVGRAGKYMRQIIKHLWDSSSTFNLAISNNVRCHPMDEKGKDREPTRQEIDMCLDHLVNDIMLLNPRVIVPVGRNAARTFMILPEDTPMSEIHGREFIVGVGGKERVIIPTYHPSFLCRSYGSFKPEENNLYDRYFIEDLRKAYEI
jgi:DNA polymerase